MERIYAQETLPRNEFSPSGRVDPDAETQMPSPSIIQDSHVLELEKEVEGFFHEPGQATPPRAKKKLNM